MERIGHRKFRVSRHTGVERSWPKGQRCIPSIVQHSKNDNPDDPLTDKEDFPENHSAINKVYLVLPYHIGGESGFATGELAPVIQVAQENEVKAELCHDDAAIKLVGTDMKLLLDSAADIKTALRTIPHHQQTTGHSQVLLQPGTASLYEIPRRGPHSRPMLTKAVLRKMSGGDKAADSAQLEKAKHLFVQRILLALGAVIKPTTEDGQNVQLRVLFGRLALHDAAQSQICKPHELSKILDRVSVRGIADFSARLEGNFSVLHRLMSECAAESSYHAAPAVLKFEAVSGDIRVEMLIDNDPSHGSRPRLAQVTRTGVFASGSKKYLDLAVSAPERAHDWCLVASNITASEVVPPFVSSIVQIMKSAYVRPSEEGKETLCAEYTMDSNSLRRLLQHVNIVSLKHAVPFHLPGSFFMLEAVRITSWRRGGEVQGYHELSMGASEWYETRNESGSVVRNLLDEERLFELARDVDLVLQKLDT